MKQKTNPVTVRSHTVTRKSSISLSLSILGDNLDPKFGNLEFFCCRHAPTCRYTFDQQVSADTSVRRMNLRAVLTQTAPESGTAETDSPIQTQLW